MAFCVSLHLPVSFDEPLIDHYRIEWEAGDTFSCPSHSWHEHWNTGDEVGLIWTVQDLPTYSYNRMVSFQSGDSDEMSFLHKSKG